MYVCTYDIHRYMYIIIEYYVNYRSTNYNNNNTVLGIVCYFGDLISKHKVRNICHVALPTHYNTSTMFNYYVIFIISY